MKFLQDPSLIASAPLEELLIIGSAFTIAALILFALAVEAGTYPRILAAIRRLRQKTRHDRHSGPGSSFLGGSANHHALPQG